MPKLDHNKNPIILSPQVLTGAANPCLAETEISHAIVIRNLAGFLAYLADSPGTV